MSSPTNLATRRESAQPLVLPPPPPLPEALKIAVPQAATALREYDQLMMQWARQAQHVLDQALTALRMGE